MANLEPRGAAAEAVSRPVPRPKSTAREYAEALGVALLLALLIRMFVVQAFKIPSGSMLPTLQIGDHILVNKFVYGARIEIPLTLGSLGSPRSSGLLGSRPEIHLGSGPDARVERSVTRARRMSRPAKAGATDEVRPPRRRLCAKPVQHAEGWRLHRCGGIRRSSDARRARTPHAALASPAAARQSRVVLSLHARVWLRPET